jgi:hypothetical protein
LAHAIGPLRTAGPFSALGRRIPDPGRGTDCCPHGTEGTADKAAWPARSTPTVQACRGCPAQCRGRCCEDQAWAAVLAGGDAHGCGAETRRMPSRGGLGRVRHGWARLHSSSGRAGAVARVAGDRGGREGSSSQSHSRPRKKPCTPPTKIASSPSLRSGSPPPKTQHTASIESDGKLATES